MTYFERITEFEAIIQRLGRSPGKPFRTETGETYDAYNARIKIEHEAFLVSHGLKRYKNSFRNIMKVLQRSGAPRSECREVIRQISGYDSPWLCSLRGGPFDHGEILGRGGEAVVLMGYPYSIDSDSCATLAAIEHLGLNVRIHKNSNYGFGTYQVEVLPASEPPLLTVSFCERATSTQETQ